MTITQDVQVERHVVAELLRQALSAGKTPALAVVSDSMTPLFRMGDKALVQPAASSSLQTGDIIVLQTESCLLTHRFWGFVNSADGVGLVTKGDRSLSYDAVMPASALLGRVMGRERNGKRLALNAGIGHKINRYLTATARLEDRLFALPHPDGIDLPPPFPISRFFAGNNKLLLRIMRRFAYLLNRAILYFISIP